MTPQGRGTVVGIDILRERLTVRMEAGEDAEYQTVAAEETQILTPRGKKNDRPGGAPPCKNKGCPKNRANADDVITLDE